MLKQLFGSGLKVGDAAPDFSGRDQEGRARALSDYRGRWLVLYFYPKDDTPGCTAEACSFRDDRSELEKMGASVLGVSVDDAASHEKFSQKHGLNFPIIADPDKTITKAYQSLSPLGVANRVTFLIDPEGRIRDLIAWAPWSSYAKTVAKRLGRLLGEA